MFISTNKFGTANIYEESDILNKKIYIYNCACLTIHTETLGWANKHKNCIVNNPVDADVIIVLGCQVTDLAIHNDIQTLLAFQFKYGCEDKLILFGGCIGQRFDIFPTVFNRIDLLYSNYQPVTDDSLITWQHPFWIKQSETNSFLRTDKKDFKYIRVGKGCHGRCQYCTIRITRKDPVTLDLNKLLPQFEECAGSNKIIIPVADTLTIPQIEHLYGIAIQYKIKFALRNIEPSNAVATSDTLLKFSESGLLDTIHIPIQSTNKDSLRQMNRSINDTFESIELIKNIKSNGVYTATNVIINYNDQSSGYNTIKEIFDHVAWNPYWNGKWDIVTAARRMTQYIPFYQISIN